MTGLVMGRSVPINPSVDDVRKAPGGARDGAVPLIAHIIFNLDVGGLKNGLINQRNAKALHAVICPKDYSDFRFRVKRATDIISGSHICGARMDAPDGCVSSGSSV